VVVFDKTGGNIKMCKNWKRWVNLKSTYISGKSG
jgi:hypothetical protein